MAVHVQSDRPQPEPAVRPPAWWASLSFYLPAPVMLGAVIVLHLGALPAWQETLGQAAVVLLGFALWVLWARANEGDD